MERTIRLLSFFMVFMFMAERGDAGWVEREKPVMKGVGWNYPAVYEGKLVFDTGGGNGKRGTYIYDTVSGKLKFLTSKGVQKAKSFYGESIVFNEDGKIYLYNLKTGKTNSIGKGKSAPDISAEWVVYGDEGVLVLYNLKKKKESRVELSGEMIATREMGPSIYGDTVVWLEKGENGGGTLFSHTLTNGRTKMYREFSRAELVNIRVLKLQKDIVLLSNHKDVSVYEMNSGSFKKLTKEGSSVFLSSMNKGKVVWDSNGAETINLYDIAKEEYTELASKGASVYSVATTGNRIFFCDMNKYELRMVEYKAD